MRDPSSAQKAARRAIAARRGGTSAYYILSGAVFSTQTFRFSTFCFDAKSSKKIKDGMIAPRIRPGLRLPLCNFILYAVLRLTME